MAPQNSFVDSIERVPPHSKEAEQCVLGSMMLDESALSVALNDLKANAFYFPAHRHIFSVMEKLYKKSTPVDLITVTDALDSADLLEQAGGAVYLSELVDTVPTTANCEHYVKIVCDKWVMRELIFASNRIVSECYNSESSVESLLENAQKEVLNVGNILENGEFKDLGQMMTEVKEHLEKLIKNKGNITGIDTGFKELNEMTSGLHEGELVIIAARPSVGKTAFALNLAENAAMDDNKAVVIFSLEIKEMQAKYVEFKTLCQNLPLAYIELVKAEGVAEANEFGKILGKICDPGNNLNERRLLYRIQELEKALLRWHGKATERTKIINGLKARVRQLDRSRDDWKNRAGEAERACLLDKQVSVKKNHRQ